MHELIDTKFNNTENEIEKKKSVYNKYWRDGSYTLSYLGEEVSLKEAYLKELEQTRKVFKKTKELANRVIGSDEFILFINATSQGVVQNPEFQYIDADRRRMLAEIETGESDILPDDFLDKNIAHCLGLTSTDPRFKVIHAFDKTWSIPDLKKCVGVVFSGSEINVLDTQVVHQETLNKIRSFIQEVKNIPKLGICFGSQILASEAGANIKWMTDTENEKIRVTSVCPIQQNEPIKEYTALAQLEAGSRVAENHGQIIDTDSIKKIGGEILAQSERGDTEIYALKKRKIIAMQFHPEAGSARVDTGLSMSQNPKEPKEAFSYDLSKIREKIFTQFILNIEIKKLA